MSRLLHRLTLFVLFVLFARAHIQITSPVVGVRPLPDDNTSPCSSSSPTFPRFQLSQTATVLVISLSASDTHGGGNASLALGYGSNPTSYNYVGPSVWLSPANPNASLNFSIPYDPLSGLYGTVQVFFTGGSNYQCLDLTWVPLTSAPPPPTTAPPSPTPPAPYVSWPTGVIGRSMNAANSAAYWLFTKPNDTLLLCDWGYATPWYTWAAWFNQVAGTYEAAVPSSQSGYSLTVNHTLIGTFNFGICPHQDTSNSFISSNYISSRSLRVVSATGVADQVVAIYYCPACATPTVVLSVNTTTGTSKLLGGIDHVSAEAGTYDWYNGVTVVANQQQVWFYDSNFNAYGLSNFSGVLDSFIFARISPSRNKTYVLGSKNKLAKVLYSIDMKTGTQLEISLSSNPIALYSPTTISSTLSYVVDDTNGLIWGTYIVSSSPATFGVFSINLSSGEVLASPFNNIDPAGLIVHA